MNSYLKMNLEIMVGVVSEKSGSHHFQIWRKCHFRDKNRDLWLEMFLDTLLHVLISLISRTKKEVKMGSN